MYIPKHEYGNHSPELLKHRLEWLIWNKYDLRKVSMSEIDSLMEELENRNSIKNTSEVCL